MKGASVSILFIICLTFPCVLAPPLPTAYILSFLSVCKDAMALVTESQVLE